jgi:HCOMODA/2-hydroxy-3-carboxy-muconic semialdehyde decarboxylase
MREAMRSLGIVLAIAVCVAASLVTLGAAPQAAPASAGAVPAALVEDLVYANRILYDQGVLDGFGHVSMRDPANANRFFLSRSMAPALVTAADIMAYDRDGGPLGAGDRRVYLERFIHAAIYRARPDVRAIVHSHSPSLIPFGVTRTPLRPLYHMSAFLGAGTPVFDIRDAAGVTDMLIGDNRLGDALAEALGGQTAILLRGHGAVNVGTSVQQVVFRAVYTETNARLQAEAMRLGTVTYLSPEEAARAAAAVDGQLLRAWDLWKARIGKIE